MRDFEAAYFEFLFQQVKLQVRRDSYDEERVKLKIPPTGAYLAYVTEVGFNFIKLFA